MHLEYWGLNEPPFSSKINIEHYFQSATHEEALARLHFIVQHNRRLGLLLGEFGTGKTFIVELLAKQLRRAGCHVSKINLLGIDRDEFLWSLATSLCGQVNHQSTHVALWRSVKDRLATLRYQRIATVLLFDDADECESEVLTTINRLVQFEQHQDSRLNIVLSCATKQVQLVGHRILELCEIPIELESLERIETNDYVHSALSRAGRDAPTFSSDALHRLHELSRGVPRAINQLVEICLLVGAAEELEVIDGETVNSVQESFRMSPVAHV